jgi:hypothetical protein
MKLNKKLFVKLGLGLILGALAGVGMSYVYGLVGVT